MKTGGINRNVVYRLIWYLVKPGANREQTGSKPGGNGKKVDANGERGIVNKSYRGEYMSQYSWTKITLAKINKFS